MKVFKRGRRGQALAEMAIVLPVLLLLVFGIIEMSNAWRSFQVVTNSAREGARVAILTPTRTVADIEDRIEAHLAGGGLVPARANISVECYDTAGALAGSTCTVSGYEARIRVDYPFTFDVLGRLAALVPLNLSSTSSMRKE
jgi:Na+-transporting methylmalonyl-CoA/oxaloacetate decarboxylase gamma subunit